MKESSDHIQTSLVGCAQTHPITSPKPEAPTFEAVFQSEFSYVCRALRRLGVRSAELEDVAQEVFISVYGKFADYDSSRPVRPWLFAFAFGSASNYHRLARNRREVIDLPKSERPTTSTPESALEDRENQVRVLRALQALPLERRGVLIMHDIDGFSGPEIGETLSIPVNTVYSRVRLARAEFKKALHREDSLGGAS